MQYRHQSTSRFDDRNIPWKRLDGIEHLAYHIFCVDEEKAIVDAAFKFAANKKIFLHKHYAEYATLVMQGELRIYSPDGQVKEVRHTGSYVLTEPGAAITHREGGGDIDAIVFFSVRGTHGAFYDILDDSLRPIERVGFEDFKALFAAQH